MLFKSRKAEREINELYAAKNYDGVIAKIGSLFADKPIPLELKKQLALAYFYKSDYQNSLRHFESIAAQEENTENLFNVMMSLLSLKKTEQARDVFNRILTTHRGAESVGKGKHFMPQLCVPFIRYYFACGLADAEHYDEAFVQLEELKKIYISVKITDDTCLYLRGIPFLGSTLKLAEKVFAGQNKDLATSAFLKELADGVDSDGKRFIKKYYQTKS